MNATIPTTQWALQACIVIALEQQSGTWCTLRWLAPRVFAPARAVGEQCALLVAAGRIQAAHLPMVDALPEPMFGVNVAEGCTVSRDLAEGDAP